MNVVLKSCFAVALCCAATSGTVQAQAYPTKPIRWIIPFPPGGGTDVISRTLAQKLTESWGQQVIADNRPGSGGTIGLAAAAKLPADGYNIVLGQLANVAIAPALYPTLPYDPVKDFTPVTLVLTSPLLLVAHPSFPAKNLKEMIAVARAKPDAVTFGSPGNGTTGHLGTEMLKTMARVKMTHVPYKGAGPVVIDLIAGHIQLAALGFPGSLPYVQAGRMRAIAVTGAKRSPQLPDVPTVSESGVPGYSFTSWYGVFAPAGTPRPIIARLNTETAAALKNPDVASKLTALGAEVATTTPDEFGRIVRDEIKRWAKVVQASGVTLE